MRNFFEELLKHRLFTLQFTTKKLLEDLSFTYILEKNKTKQHLDYNNCSCINSIIKESLSSCLSLTPYVGHGFRKFLMVWPYLEFIFSLW